MYSQANASSFVEMLGGQVLTRIGVGVILTDSDGYIQWANDRQQRFTGVPFDLLRGMLVTNHDWFTVSGVDRSVRKAISTGLLQQQKLDLPRLSCRVEVSPLTIQERCLGAAIFLYDDPASEMQTPEITHGSFEAGEQKALLQFLNTLLDHLVFSVAVLDEDLNVLYANSAAKERCQKPLLGLPWQVMLPTDLHAQIEQALHDCQNSANPVLIVGPKTGPTSDFYSMSHMQSGDGLPFYVMAIWSETSKGVTVDTTAFALQMADLCQFAARVVHDIRNPLTALMCELELLRHENLYEEGGVHKFQGAIDLFSNQARRINSLLEEIEVLGADNPVNLAPCNLSDLLLNACAVAEMRRPYKGTHVVTDIPEQLPMLTCDSLRLQKVMAELLLYALDEAGAAGQVDLSLRHMVPKKFVLRIVYYGADGAMPKPVPTPPLWRKANLRLAMASAIVMELGGKMSMQRYEGLGTEISIELPRESEPRRNLVRVG